MRIPGEGDPDKPLLQYEYHMIPARSAAEATQRFMLRFGFPPVQLFGPPGCQDAPADRTVPRGFYACVLAHYVEDSPRNRGE